MIKEIGILKIGANITQSKAIKTASNMDIFSLADILLEQDFQVTIITKRTRNTIIGHQYNLIDIMDFIKFNHKMDALLVFNGAINFFGGAESPELIENYKIMKIHENVWYVMTDGRFPLKQVWPAISGRDWGQKYNPEDLVLGHIDYMYQGYDHKKLIDLVAKGKDAVPIRSIRTLNIPWAIMLQEHLVYPTPLKERDYDLVYIASNRDSYRAKRFEEFYNLQMDASILHGGSMKLPFPMALTSKKIGTIPNSSFVKTLAKAKATVIIGDKFYCNNFYTLRIFESIFAGCITFIDEQFDINKKIYANMTESMRRFMYVRNRNEIKRRLEILRNMPEEEVKNIRKEQLRCLQTMEGSSEFKERLINIITGE